MHCINKYNVFRKNNFFKSWKTLTMSYIFGHLFNVSHFNRWHLDSHTCSYNQSAAIWYFDWSLEENLASSSYVVGTGKNMLTAFSVNCRHDSLILHQNSTRGDFLPQLQSGILNPINELFFVTVKHTGKQTKNHSPSTLNLQWIFYRCLIFF